MLRKIPPHLIPTLVSQSFPLICAGLLLSLPGCGDSKSKDERPSEQTPPSDTGKTPGGGTGGSTGSGTGGETETTLSGHVPATLVGKWVSKCIPLLDQNRQSGVVSEVSFTADGKFTAYFREFFDSACTDKNRSTQVSGVAKDGINVTTPQGASGVDYVVTSIQLTPESAGARLSLNNTKFCGITSWTVATATDVTGKQCKKTQNDGSEADIRFNARGELVKDVFKVDGSKLQLGIQFNESGTGLVAERPTTFNDVDYTKAP